MDKPTYYAIIPSEVRYDKRLRDKSKLLFGEITALSNKDGTCWASNNYFAKIYDCTPQSISKLIANLKECGYIDVTYEYKENSKEIDKRVIKMVSTKLYGGINKCLEGYQQKVKDNNTSINNTSINNILLSYHSTTLEVINYLNDKTEKHFKPVQSNTKFIEARLKEGFTLEDFKKVIDKKCNQWKDTDMDKYLRPQTLFIPNNFQSYLNEKEIKKEEGLWF